MSEFNNRISTQRIALKVINGAGIYNEPLLSLADKAINRWIDANTINSNDKIIELLKKISEKLFFLANKSQEQITEEYSEISTHVTKLLGDLSAEISKRSRMC